MGNNLGPNELWSGSRNPGVKIEVVQIMIHKADEPDIVVNFLDADRRLRDGESCGAVSWQGLQAGQLFPSSGVTLSKLSRKRPPRVSCPARLV
jgi:hypothetical protein